MKKIIIIGCPGSGKSTFAKKLHQITHIPLYHLDLLYWNKDKTTVDKKIFMHRLNEIFQKNTWIIDGNYNATMELRMKHCDTIIFLDYPVELCLEGIQARKDKPRSDMPWIESDEDKDFIDFIKNYNLQSKPNVLALLNQYQDKNIYIFNERSHAELFLNQLQQ